MNWPDKVVLYSNSEGLTLKKSMNETNLQRNYVNEEIFMEMVAEKAAKENLLEQSEQILNNETRKVDVMDEEIACLRSVLSEDPCFSVRDGYTQWHRAEELRAERELWYDTETFGEVKSE